MTKLAVTIAGAGGRMGRANIAAILGDDRLELAGALDRTGAPALGSDAGVLAGEPPLGITLTDDPAIALEHAQAIIDFTSPDASVALADEAATRGLVHIIGTTGFAADHDSAIAEAAKNGARIVKAGNMSLGVNLLMGLVKKAAEALGDDFDIEVLEMHHNQKVDAPSGTALMLGEAAAEGRGIDLETHAVKSREGITGAREKGTIGFATLRGGGVIGEHSVIFASPSERIELTHKAQDRSLFARGAITAALWAADRPAGLYDMHDVLGLRD